MAKKQKSAFESLPGATQFGAGRPPKSRQRPTIFPKGPALFKMGTKPQTSIGGPGEPPPGFLTAHNSKDEWVLYWAFAKTRGTPKNPRTPPFIGGMTGPTSARSRPRRSVWGGAGWRAAVCPTSC